MGLSLLHSDCKTAVNNPQPDNFKLIEMLQISRYTIVKVNYPTCTNYEGNKLLILKDISIEEVMDLDELDPHFTKEGQVIARFAPTEEGWNHAKQMIIGLIGHDMMQGRSVLLNSKYKEIS